MKNIFLSIIVFLITTSITIAQNSKKAKSFVEMQLEFDNFKKTNNLVNKKGWKYYKRWEQEALMHTMPNGELADPFLVNTEYIKAAKAITDNALLNKKSKLLFGTWSPEGPNSVEPQYQLSNYGIGRINCIAYHPNLPSTYWVGVAQGGVWKTTDNGLTWTSLTDNLPVIRISDIAVNPNNTDEIYIAVGDFEYIDFGLKLNGRKRNTHYGLGVYKTIDGGITWLPTGLSFALNSFDASLTRKIIIHPTLNNKLVAATSNGMYTSNNSGTTWTQVMDSLFWDLIQDPNTPNTLYAATGFLKNANVGYASVMKSIDFGVTWTLLPTGIPPTDTVQRIKLCMAPGNSNIIYALCVDMQRGMYGLYKTSDAGASWTLKFNTTNLLDFYDGLGIGGQGTYDLVLMVPPQDTSKVYAGGINIWGSEDGGTTFEPVTNKYISTAPDIHVDQHFLSYHPITQNIFICNDGGIYRAPILFNTSIANLNASLPFPTIWANISAGLQITAFYRMCSDKDTSNYLIAGAQDNATYLNDGTNWYNIYGGDGMDNYVDKNYNYIASAQFGNFLSYENGIYYSGGIAGAEWTAPLTHDNTSGNFYIGGQELYSSDFTITPSQISDFSILSGNGSNEPPITSIAAVGSTIYVTKRPLYPLAINGYCYKTNNTGLTWQDITAGLPDSLYFTAIEVNPNFPQEAWVSCAGFSVGNKVYKTINGGTTWTNESLNLPNLPINMIKCVDPITRLMMVAADVGVYYKYDSLSTWQLYNIGLPNAIVSDIEVNVIANKIMVSTFGRGIWSTNYNQFIITAINKNKVLDNELTFFPNPATNEVEIKSNDNAVAYAKIYDTQGKLILQTKIINNKMNITTLSSQTYIVEFFSKNNEKIASNKLLKQ